MSDDKSKSGVVHTSGFDAWIKSRILVPIASKIPRGVHPNSITMLTPILATSSFLSAAAAVGFEGSVAALGLRLFAGLCMLGSMLSDHLDGLHARNTGQTSKLGELLDHWLDSYHVAIAGAGLGITLSMPSWLVGLSMLGSAAIYNAQLVLFHKSGTFVHPRTGGATAQSILGLFYILAGLFFFAVPPQSAWLLSMLPWIWGFVIAVQFFEPTYFYPKLGKEIREHFRFLALGAVFCFGAHAQWLSLELMIVLQALLSLRIGGTYVARTVTLGQRYFGPEPPLVMGMAALVVSSMLGADVYVGGVALTQVIAWTVAAYLFTRSMGELLNGVRFAQKRGPLSVETA